MSDSLWGGRFEAAMAAAMTAYTESLDVDRRMVAEDIWGSQAHAVMLAQCGIISDDDLAVILTWLERAREDHEAGRLQLKPELEDVHMNVERYLIDGAGPEYGGRLHTARSRNDQVLTDARLYVRARLLETETLLIHLCGAMLDLAEAHAETVMPGYTHSQHAQPITLGYWASAHVSAWSRDLRRLRQVYEIVNESPLGACALAGTDLPIDRHLTAELLGFERVHEHALDVTSSRDFLIESVAALSILMLGLSRLSEELVWWSTYEFRTVQLDDAYSSGSSIMPQKKNPDCAELTRGKAARVMGDLVQLLTVVKSVSFGYSRDLQEDKPPAWDAFDQVRGALATLAGAVATLRVDPRRMRELVDANFATATQLANWLVAVHGVPFRRAHEIVGRLVGELGKAQQTFTALQEVRRLLGEEGVEADEPTLREVLDPLRGVARQNSLGGPAPEETRRMIAALRERLAAAELDLSRRAEQIAEAKARLRTLIAAALGQTGKEDGDG
ncbi:MAG: argininosuccinate lyase [Armatimonadetes bacterium]|nr:argininosuccinate lyase [Armatimonadota bacterium]